MSILTLTDAAWSYERGAEPALSHVSAILEAGQAMALIGPNGSGKSTLLKGVLGLLALSAGSVRVGEANAGARASIGYLPQVEHLDPDFPISLRQVVMLGRYRQLGWWRWPSRRDQAAVAKALQWVGLTGEAKRRFGALSGGQQQRGLLARALAAEPVLVLLDEPFNGLDQPNRDALLHTIRELKAAGVAFVITTHDLDLAREVCDTVMLVNRTQVAFGALDEVLTLANLQRVFHEVQVEVDEHTLVLPTHEGH
jgi:zinc/manganese transport system ATP-binding protein